MPLRPAAPAALLLLLLAAPAFASVEEGRRLYQERGCAGCHRIDGEGGAIGPDLTREAAAGRDRDWHVRHFMDPSGVTPGSVMPRLVKSEEEAEQLADYVMSLGAEAGAAAPAGAAPAQPAPAQAAPAQAAPAQAAPAQAAPSAPAPAQSAPAAPAPAAPPTAQQAPPEAAPAATATPAPAAEREAAVERGRSVYASKGCSGCHRIRGSGGTIGPDLTFEGEVQGHDADWHRRHLANPRAVTPGSTMPPFALGEGERDDLVAFLRSLKRLEADRALDAETSRRFAELGDRLGKLQKRVARAHLRGRNVDDLRVELTGAWTRVGTVEEMVRAGNVSRAAAEIDQAEAAARHLTGALDDFDAQLRDRRTMAVGVVLMLLFGSVVITRKVKLLVREWDAAEGERDLRRARGRKGPEPPPAASAPEAPDEDDREDA